MGTHQEPTTEFPVSLLVLVLVYTLEAPTQVMELPVSTTSESGNNELPHPGWQQIHAQVVAGLPTPTSAV